MITLLMVRHGESDHNLSYRLNERNQPVSNLTNKGVSQAQQAGQNLASRGITHLYSSELQRTIQTSDIISSHIKVKPQRDRRLNELQTGLHNKRGVVWLLRLFFSTNRLKANFGGESLEESQQRVASFLDDLKKLPSGSIVCAVAHQHTIQATMAILEDKPLSKIIFKQLKHAQAYEFEL